MTGARHRALAARGDDVQLRVVATNDLLGTLFPLPSTHGAGGCIAGIERLVEEEQAHGPTVWLDGGDFSGGALAGLGADEWSVLDATGLRASVAGNHEADQGLSCLQQNAARVSYQVLCADRDLNLPATALLPTLVGAVGIVGISHPAMDRLAPVPPRAEDWSGRVVASVRRLRVDGARWVIALCHDGVTWEPGTRAVRTTALERHLAPVLEHVDAVVAGHTLVGWVGRLRGVPVLQADGFAGSVAVVDLLGDGGTRTQPLARVPQPGRDPVPQPLRAPVADAGRRLVGELEEVYTSVPSAPGYLGDLVAESVLDAVPDAEGVLVPSCELWTQAPLDGAVAALGRRVTDLDVRRIFPFDEPWRLVELNDQEFTRVLETHDAAADWRNHGSDGLWWNWARAAAGRAQRTAEPRRVAISAFSVGVVEEWLGRPLRHQSTGVRGGDALRTRVSR